MNVDIEGLRVMIVEDQFEVRMMIRNMLTTLGVTQVFEAADGREALDFLDAADDLIDIIVCDWNMPRMNGAELLRQLRTVNPFMPFLMVTGRKDLESVREAKQSGVTGYIAKPFSPSQMEVKLRVMAQQV